MFDLFEMVLEFVYFLVTSMTRHFFKNKKIHPSIRMIVALILFALPLLLLMYATPMFIELNEWWIYLLAFSLELYLGYLTIKYVRGILLGFEKES